MPAFLEKALAHAADKKGLKGAEKDRYIWGTMNHMGVVHGNKITSKGREMQAKHDADTSHISRAAATIKRR